MKIEKLVELKEGDIIISNSGIKKEFVSLNTSSKSVRIKNIETGVINRLSVSWVLKITFKELQGGFFAVLTQFMNTALI